MFCTNCGSARTDDAQRFCTTCGTPFRAVGDSPPEAPAPPVPSEPTIAGTMAAVPYPDAPPAPGSVPLETTEMAAPPMPPPPLGPPVPLAPVGPAAPPRSPRRGGLALVLGAVVVLALISALVTALVLRSGSDDSTEDARDRDRAGQDSTRGADQDDDDRDGDDRDGDETDAADPSSPDPSSSSSQGTPTVLDCWDGTSGARCPALVGSSSFSWVFPDSQRSNCEVKASAQRSQASWCDLGDTVVHYSRWNVWKQMARYYRGSGSPVDLGRTEMDAVGAPGPWQALGNLLRLQALGVVDQQERPLLGHDLHRQCGHGSPGLRRPRCAAHEGRGQWRHEQLSVVVPQPGQSFGRYDVGRQLGRGGMGIVFEATHRDLERAVALKVLAPELAEDPSYRNRFLREARILARLDSPHVVRVFDAGEHDGSLFLATELLPDGDLADLIERQGALSPPRAADLVRQVASGLYDAHRAGILHRDIKPSNVLLKRLPDGSLRALLCDFGIAAVSDGRDMTATQGVIGTPPYMAPERHDGAEATIASDIYALGCVLWSAVTGHAPYEGSAAQILLGHLHKPIPQLLGATAEEVQFNQTLRMAMAKDPAARFRSAEAFGRALGYFAAAQPGQPAGGPTRERAAEHGPATPSVSSLPPPPPPPALPPASTALPPPPVAATTQLGSPAPVPPAAPSGTAASGQASPARPGRRRLVAASAGVALLVASGVGAAALVVGEDDEPSTAAAADLDAPISSGDVTAVQQPTTTGTAASVEGPLAIDADFVNQPCNDEFVVILATSGNRAEYEEKLGAAVRGNPDARYLDGSASCAAFLPEDPATGALIFNAYLGPFPTMSAACQTLARIKSPVAWVRRLANPSKVRELCFCLSSASEQPAIEQGYDSASFRLRHQVRQAQWALATMGLLREDQIYGAYTDDLVEAVTRFQRRRGFAGNGVLDSTTWQALHADYCPLDAYVVAR